MYYTTFRMPIASKNAIKAVSSAAPAVSARRERVIMQLEPHFCDVYISKVDEELKQLQCPNPATYWRDARGQRFYYCNVHADMLLGGLTSSLPPSGRGQDT